MDQNQDVGSERHTTPLFLSPYELDRKRWLSRRTAATATSRLGFHPFITVLRDHTFPATGNALSLQSEAHTDPPGEEEEQEEERNTERRRRQRMEELVGPAELSSSSNGSC
ncbi:hypothetical protein GOODEAATRI_030682 [Goodea atripinnis]|uniref:Uncharacterized protein n=1 Tax=Goodea atripinnis TaxID=208336 RepID=A0ABV0P924_9TELE